MRTSILGEVKLLTPEQTISALWQFRDNRVKFDLGTDQQRWRTEIWNCIMYAKVIEGLRFYYQELKQRYHFITVQKFFYGSKTFGISYDQKTYTMAIKTGLPVPTNSSTVVPGIVDFSKVFAEYLDGMLSRVLTELPSEIAASVLKESKDFANGIPH